MNNVERKELIKDIINECTQEFPKVKNNELKKYYLDKASNIAVLCHQLEMFSRQEYSDFFSKIREMNEQYRQLESKMDYAKLIERRIEEAEYLCHSTDRVKEKMGLARMTQIRGILEFALEYKLITKEENNKYHNCLMDILFGEKTK